mmetsp:Transcript_30228/g.88403  ORF Transcript_30228/g.88403 Transcript_30228/m.88403 type:complete len:83 (+) Transcript_30228:3-251(+)
MPLLDERRDSTLSGDLSTIHIMCRFPLTKIPTAGGFRIGFASASHRREKKSRLKALHQHELQQHLRSQIKHTTKTTSEPQPT